MKNILPFFVAALAGSSALITGCFTTTIVSGRPSRPATVAYDSRWHHGVLWGIGEVSGPYDLSEICPHGWAEIETETSFVNGVVSAATSSLYSPQTVSVRCSASAAAGGSSEGHAGPMQPTAPATADGVPPAPPAQ
jgi:hypothetical protein